MIISLDELRTYITTDLKDSVLEARLQAIESTIRQYTNNNFQKRNIRFCCPVVSQKLYLTSKLIREGDTVQITDSIFNDGVYHITETDFDYTTLNEQLIDEPAVTITKVEYPKDVKMGAVNMLKWELENRDKVGIQSETISRHSVTYYNMDGDNSVMGYPKSIMGFLRAYKKPRF